MEKGDKITEDDKICDTNSFKIGKGDIQVEKIALTTVQTASTEPQKMNLLATGNSGS